MAEIAGIIYEASIDGFGIDLMEGATVTKAGKNYEVQNTVTRNTFPVGKWEEDRMELPIKATNGMNAERIKEIFEDALQQKGGATVSIRTAQKVYRGFKCFLDGPITESLDTADVSNVNIVARPLQIEELA